MSQNRGAPFPLNVDIFVILINLMWAGKTFSAKFTSKEVLQGGIIKGKIVKVP